MGKLKRMKVVIELEADITHDNIPEKIAMVQAVKRKLAGEPYNLCVSASRRNIQQTFGSDMYDTFIGLPLIYRD